MRPSIESPVTTTFRMFVLDGISYMTSSRTSSMIVRSPRAPVFRFAALRFMAEGVDGLLHEATRPAGKPPLTPAVIEGWSR